MLIKANTIRNIMDIVDLEQLTNQAAGNTENLERQVANLTKALKEAKDLLTTSKAELKLLLLIKQRYYTEEEENENKEIIESRIEEA